MDVREVQWLKKLPFADETRVSKLSPKRSYTEKVLMAGTSLRVVRSEQSLIPFPQSPYFLSFTNFLLSNNMGGVVTVPRFFNYFVQELWLCFRISALNEFLVSNVWQLALLRSSLSKSNPSLFLLLEWSHGRWQSGEGRRQRGPGTACCRPHVVCYF